MKIQSAKPYIPKEDIKDILNDFANTLSSGILTKGPYVKKFEDLFAKYIGVKNAIAVNSGTCSLEIPLRYFNVKDKEVIVPTNTFIATSNAVIFAGGKPILADIKPDTLCIDPDDVLKKITTKTRGIIVVHIAGLVCPQMNELQDICKKYGLFLIEDAAHAHGATIDGKKAGSLSNAASFSFFATKIMTTAEGGMITTNDDKLAEIARSMRHHGIGNEQNILIRLGYNWRMDELSAILGIHQLKRLYQNIIMRNKIAEKYNKMLAKTNGLSCFKTYPNIKHSYYKYPVLLDEGIDRIKLTSSMKENHNISLGTIYYPPCHLQPFYKDIFGFEEGALPVSERILNRTVALPMFAQMKDREIEYVVKALKQEISSSKNYGDNLNEKIKCISSISRTPHKAEFAQVPEK